MYAINIPPQGKETSMSWKIFIAIIPSVLILLVSACTPQAGPAGTAVPSQDGTSGNLTQVAAIVESTYAAQTVYANSPATSTPEISVTPTLTSSPTLTLTPVVPMVSVSSLTNCRSGPGTAYDILGGLPVGQTAKVVGRSVNNDFWIIKLPSNLAISCWLWGQYATVTGNTSGLAIFDPPPTPTPLFTATPQAIFDVTFASVIDCGGGVWAIKFKVHNTGSITWESNRVIATDQTTSETTTIDQNTFPEYADAGCAVISDSMNLEPGETAHTSSNAFSADPTGHPVTATVRVCSKDGMQGTCVEKTITFTP
jgi:hypothetical protein